jgi:hypothetical protein
MGIFRSLSNTFELNRTLIARDHIVFQIIHRVLDYSIHPMIINYHFQVHQHHHRATSHTDHQGIKYHPRHLEMISEISSYVTKASFLYLFALNAIQSFFDLPLVSLRELVALECVLSFLVPLEMRSF